ncbi:MAG: hypothetical protein V3S71_05930 [Acidobacteriota bacterium]
MITGLRIACACAVSLAAGIAGASQTRELSFGRSHPWNPVSLEGIALASDGSLSLSPVLRKLNLGSDSSAPYLLCQTRDSEGNLYVGAAGPARVYRFTSHGNATLLFQGDEMQVSALAVDSNDQLYVATSPRGRVYRVNRSGESRPFFETEERYIWSLLSDGSDQLWVGTGGRGKLYRVDSGGRGKVVLDSPDAHITAIAKEADGSILAGTDGQGLVYKIHKDGTIRTLLQGGFRQVSDLAVGAGGKIYVGLVDSTRDDKRRKRRERRDGEDLLITSPFDSQSPLMLGEEARPLNLDEALEPPEALSPQSRIFALDATGAAQEVWRSPNEWLHTLEVDSAGTLYFGTGQPARLYRLEAPNRWTLLGTPEASHVTSIGTTADGRLFLLTGRPGQVFMAADSVAKSASLVTQPIDAGSFARWGRVRWSTGDLPNSRSELFSRSGNSARPDSAWSEWSPAMVNSSGTPIVSPAGRYLQLRVTLNRSSDSNPTRLRELSLSYLPANRPPRIEQVGLHAPGEYFLPRRNDGKTEPGAPAFGRKRHRTSLRTVSWRISDPDGDRPVATLKLRGAGAEEWSLLADGILSNKYSWSVAHLDEGWYELLLQASDSRDNSPESAMQTAAAPVLFKVDYTAPLIKIKRSRLDQNSPQIDFEVTDELSTLSSVRLWINQAPAQRLMPDDGLEDSRSETYRWQGDARPRRVRIEASDSDGNRAQWRWAADQPSGS